MKANDFAKPRMPRRVPHAAAPPELALEEERIREGDAVEGAELDVSAVARHRLGAVAAEVAAEDVLVPAPQRRRGVVCEL